MVCARSHGGPQPRSEASLGTQPPKDMGRLQCRSSPRAAQELGEQTDELTRPRLCGWLGIDLPSPGVCSARLPVIHLASCQF